MQSNWLPEIVKRSETGPYMKEKDFELRLDDEVVVITHSRNLPALEARWGPRKPHQRGH